MGDAITVIANLSTKGFEKGSAAMKKAINSLGVSAAKFGKTTQQSANSVIGSLKRMLPTIIGVGSAYGVISKAVSAFMSQNELLSKQMSSVWTALGNVLGPIITQLITWVTTAVSYLLSFLKLLGLTGKTASELSKSAKGAGSDLQKTIAGFDELNVLQDNSGGSGGATLKDIEPSEWMEKLAELLRKGLWDDAADMIIDRMNGLIDIFVNKSKELGEKIGYYLGGALHIIARLINDLDWHGIGQGLANFVNGVLEYIDGNDIGAIIVGKITIALRIITGFLENLDWGLAAEIFNGIVIGALDSLTRAIESADFQKIGAGIRAFFQNIDWADIADAILGVLQAAWDAAIDMLWGILAGDSETEPPLVQSLRRIGEALTELWETIVTFATEVWEQILKPILEWSVEAGLPVVLNLLATIIEKICGFVQEHMPEIIALIEALGIAIAGIGLVKGIMKVIDTAKTLISVVSALANPTTIIIALVVAIIAYLIHLYNTNEEFRQKVDEVWNKVKEAIGGAVDWAKEKFDQFKEKIDTVKQKISDFRDSVVEKFESIKTKAQGLIDKIKEVFSFKWEIPPIKLPHITVAWEPTGDFARFFGVTAIPHLGVEWYKRGGIIDGAHLIGAGEDGAEAIVPLERNTEWIDMVVRGLLERLEANDFSMNKIGGALAALSDIAETVAYRTPSVAQGSILPYSVAYPQGQNYPSDDGSWSSEDIRELSEKLDTIIYLFEHFQFVADFGNNLRAFARQVTKEQKKDTISEGR